MSVTKFSSFQSKRGLLGCQRTRSKGCTWHLPSKPSSARVVALSESHSVSHFGTTVIKNGVEELLHSEKMWNPLSLAGEGGPSIGLPKFPVYPGIADELQFPTRIVDILASRLVALKELYSSDASIDVPTIEMPELVGRLLTSPEPQDPHWGSTILHNSYDILLSNYSLILSSVSSTAL